MASAAYHRSYRRRRKANGGAPLTRPNVATVAAARPSADAEPAAVADVGATVAVWAARRLRVPPGHAAAGRPLQLPRYIVEFFDDAFRPSVREAGCFVARKNAKSAAVAVLILAHLCADGPLRRRGWRGGVASITKEKAVELWTQTRDIAAASAIEEITFGKVPRIAASAWGEVAFLSADKAAGHASGFDAAVVDEIGLIGENARPLVQGLLSSTSARNGRLIAISILGDSPLAREMVERGDDPATVVHLHQAPKGCRLDDESAWEMANPALDVVKSRSYMRDMARRAAAAPAEQRAFRSHDLNQPGSPTADDVVPLDGWEACAGAPQPDRAGPFVVGFDLGGAVSFTAAAAYWYEVGRLDVWGAVGDVPDLAARGEADGVGGRYAEMAGMGFLRTFPGRVTPCGPFLAWVADELDGERPRVAVADRYRQGEAEDAIAASGAAWPCEWRAQGAGRDGSADVRAFQRAVVAGTLRPGLNLLLESALLEARLRFDGNGNPALDKARSRGRIDALSAAVLAVGAGERAARPQPGAFLGIF